MIARKYKELVRHLLPKAHKNHRILQGTLKGNNIYTSWHDYPGAILGTTEGPLLEWFAAHVLQGETWLDIGAHYGYTALALSNLVGSTGRVIAFEPILTTAACVSRTRTLNKLAWLQVVPMGLGSATAVETRLLPVVRGMADSTVDQHAWMEPILISSFDELSSGLLGADDRVDGIKIDVQGMELEVLRGLRRTLCADRPKVILEFHAGVSRSDIIGLLKDCGYPKAGRPVEGEDIGEPVYEDDHSYAFFPEAAVDRAPLPLVASELSYTR